MIPSCCLALFMLLCYASKIAADCNPSDYATENAYIFIDSIIDPKDIHLPNAQNALSHLTRMDIEVGVLGDTAPLLHHLLNLYRLSDIASGKSKMIDITLKCLELGFDASTPYKSDPPLLYKSIIIKEMNLTKALIDSNPQSVIFMISGHKQWLAQFLATLYSIPSEPVPLAKLLLHADTIASQDVAKLSPDRKKKLLEGAVLNKANVKPSDLARHSDKYNQIVAGLGASKEVGGNSIRLLDLIQCLDEVASKVHQSFLDTLWQHIESNGLEDGITIILQFIEVLTSFLIVDDDKVERVNKYYDSDRNALHYLSISGGQVMLDQLTLFFTRLLTYDDIGAKASVIIQLLMESSLSAKDRRGHSPLSYAIMRFQNDSPILKSFNALKRLLRIKEDKDFDGHFIRENILEDYDRRTINSGGWNVLKSVGILAHDDRCDVLEVSMQTLPSNKEFFVQFINTGSPVIFRNMAIRAEFNKSVDKALARSTKKGRNRIGNTMQELRQVFEKANFIKKYGEVKVPASTIPYSETFGIRSTTATLEEVANSQDDDDDDHMEVSLNQEGSVVISEDDRKISNNSSMGMKLPLYTFCTPSEQWKSRLYREVPLPRCLQREQNSDEDSDIGAIDRKFSSWSFELQFYLGSAGTGAPVHFHGHALNTLAYGEKAWVLFPPVHSFYSTVPGLKYFQQLTSNTNSSDNNFKPLYCTQRAGDILYVPALWGHGTLNTKQSIGVAHEFSVESFGME